MTPDASRGGIGEPHYDPLTSLLVLTAKIETQVQNLADQKRTEHERLGMEIARVERDTGRDLAEMKADQARLAEIVSGLRLSMAKAAGMAAVISALVSTLLALGVSKLLAALD
jgi:hypothetical protein